MFFKQCLDFEWSNPLTNGDTGIFYGQYTASCQRTEYLLKMGRFLAELWKALMYNHKTVPWVQENPLGVQ